MFFSWITSNIFLDTIGPIIVLLLSALLLIKEFMRTSEPHSVRGWMRILNILILPLLLLFGVVVIGRLISL